MTDARERIEQLVRGQLGDDEAANIQQQVDADPKLRAIYQECLANEEFLAKLANVANHSPPQFPGLKSTSATVEPSFNKRIGSYTLLEEIGQGGMGVVYRAEQRNPVRREVALKLIKVGMDTQQVLARFEAERQALALMDHPNVAAVYDAGVTNAGRPFFVMELIRGKTITDYADLHRLSINERLELFVQICSAVQHAHQKAVIHRDIKPSNVLVTECGGKAIPKIIDFGVAKATSQPLTDRTLFTEQGQIVGTFEYMSPEQADLTGTDIDTRTDIYSLGVLLYQLMVGTLPFDSAELRSHSLDEIQRILREQDPSMPSARLRDLGASAKQSAYYRRTDLTSLMRHVRGDLDWIIGRAMEKERARRYPTASELAEDILRHLGDEPVLASPPSTAYRLRKFVRKNRGAVTTIAATAFALVAGTVGTTLAYLEAERAREAESQMRHLANAQFEQILPLADLKRLDQALAAADSLWPIRPHLREPMHQWLAEQAAPLQENLPRHRAALAKHKSHPLATGEQYVRNSETAVRSSAKHLSVPAHTQRLQHDVLVELVARLERFADPDPLIGEVASVRRRLAMMQSIEQQSLLGVEAVAGWAEAREDIRRSESYNQLNLPPQFGLLPLGRNEHSGLWEFWHVQSGSRPVANLHGSSKTPWGIAGDTGMVMVLIPGGTFWMGAQREKPQDPNYDPNAKEDEKPVHKVTLEPFFLSKYEMTQGQWQRFTGNNPSHWSPATTIISERYSLADPVEWVNWNECHEVLFRLGLALPTEAQWEYATRAGTSTVWWTGNEASGLQDAANIADVSMKRYPELQHLASLDIDDGRIFHGVVGSYAPNPFGLHDVIGNVCEWCRDPYSKSYDNPPTTENSPHKNSHPVKYVHRGGCYEFSASTGRSSARNNSVSTLATPGLGVRPAMCIDFNE